MERRTFCSHGRRTQLRLLGDLSVTLKPFSQGAADIQDQISPIDAMIARPLRLLDVIVDGVYFGVRLHACVANACRHKTHEVTLRRL